MDAKLENLFKQTFNLSPKDKVMVARGALGEISKYLDSIGCTSEQISALIINATRLFVSADRRTVNDEFAIFKAITEAKIDANYFYNMTNNGADPEFVEATLDLVKTFSHDARVAVLSYGLMIMSADDSIDYKETAIVKRFLEII